MAALLNAASSGVSYAFTSTQIVNMYNDVVSGFLNAEATKDGFAAANEAGCPLN